MKVRLQCCFCRAAHECSVEVPAGWNSRHGLNLDVDDAFCPTHAPVERFFEAQCSGCVSGWGDCGLWRDALCHSTVTDAELAVIREGVCPRRVNGTYASSPAGIESVNISDPAPRGASEQLASAIAAYQKKWRGRHTP